jgi:hypothetical protein
MFYFAASSWPLLDRFCIIVIAQACQRMSPIVFCRRQGGRVDGDSNRIREDGRDGEEDQSKASPLFCSLSPFSLTQDVHQALSASLRSQ